MSTPETTAAQTGTHYVVRSRHSGATHSGTNDLSHAVALALRDPDQYEVLDRHTGQPVDLKAQQHRQDVIAGLRQLIAFLERHPELPVEWAYARPYSSYGHGARAAAAARLLGAAEALDRDEYIIIPDGYADSIELRVDFGDGVHYALDAKREDVCTPRIEDGKVVWDLPQALAEGAEARS